MQKMLFNKLKEDHKKQIKLVDSLYDIYINDNEIKIIILTENDKLLAYLTFKQFETLNIYMIYSFDKRKGYATKLLNSLTTHCTLEVNKNNLDAIKMYEKNNFIRLREVDNLYDGEGGYLYERKSN